MIYRIHNHSYDLSIPGSSTVDALMLTIDSSAAPTATYVPIQFTRPELIQLLLESWVTSYELFHEQAHPESVQTSKPVYLKKSNKQVKIKFDCRSSPPSKQFTMEIKMFQPIELFPTDPSLVAPPMPILFFSK